MPPGRVIVRWVGVVVDTQIKRFAIKLHKQLPAHKQEPHNEMIKKKTTRKSVSWCVMWDRNKSCSNSGSRVQNLLE